MFNNICLLYTSGGTATYCAISGMDVAAKTGTTDDDYDRWLCGFTPYYAAACWFGYDQPETVYYSGNNPAGVIWDNVMTAIHEDLENATFTRPSGIVAVSYTHLLAAKLTNWKIDIKSETQFREMLMKAQEESELQNEEQTGEDSQEVENEE